MPNNQEKKLDEKNRVIIRIWASRANLHKQGGGVGHVSMELESEKKYYSFWPSSDPHFKQSLEKQACKYNISLMDDELDEGDRTDNIRRKANYTFYFYSLNKLDIKDKIYEMADSVKWWRLYCGLFNDIESCVSYISKLLIAGGIGNLVNTSRQLTGSSKEAALGSKFTLYGTTNSNKENIKRGSEYTVEQLLNTVVASPDALVKTLQIALLAEWKKFPTTRELSYHQDSGLDELEIKKALKP